MAYRVEVDTEYMIRAGVDVRLLDEIVTKLAEKFVIDHGAEVLKRIGDQTIDAKVIQKVVSNLRKELMAKNEAN